MIVKRAKEDKCFCWSEFKDAWHKINEGVT